MTTLRALFHLHTSPSNPALSHTSPHLHLSCSFKPKNHKPPSLFSSTTPPPARDRVIDFGKHKGKMLGTLPSSYLRWVSKNLRARDFEDWAKLADQVLNDAVYKDRIEWELAENVLNGNRSSALGSGGVSELLEMSERFRWDNNDKIGWSKVNFELLGTSRGGRIPRLSENGGGEREVGRMTERQKKKKVEVLGEGGERRRERRGRLRMKKGEGGERRRERRGRLRMKKGEGGEREAREEREEKLGILEKGRGNFGNGVGLGRNKENGDDWMVENSNRFPGREALLKKARMRRFS